MVTLTDPKPLTTGVGQINVNNALAQTQSWCRYDPLACLRQVAVETGFLATAYVFILAFTRSPMPRPLAVLQFALLFSLLSFAGRQISDNLGDKISITAISGLGAKLVSILAPKFVAW